MGTITTIGVIKLGMKIAIFIGGVLAIINIENLINKKPFKKMGGRHHDFESRSEIGKH